MATPDACTAQKRCAIYTRRSIEQSPGHQFSSVEAQRAICSSYVASQRPNGWTELSKHYDDEGKSGGNLNRPALQDLLSDVEAGVVDVVVIYKLDRISRTLLDFVRLMDLFQQFGVSFVAVTQNFDTADTTGRLILNVLLTFAQFEREVTGERIRNKIAASKRQGRWIGGRIPLGYDISDENNANTSKRACAFEALQATKKFHQCRIISPALTATRRAQPL